MTREETVREVVRRLVEHYRPDRVYLFGSTARGNAGEDSDLDFLVVLPDDASQEMLFDGGIYQRLWDIPLAVDVVPFRRSTFESRKGWLMSLPAIALREGLDLARRFRQAGKRRGRGWNSPEWSATRSAHGLVPGRRSNRCSAWSGPDQTWLLDYRDRVGAMAYIAPRLQAVAASRPATVVREGRMAPIIGIPARRPVRCF
jgi:uncharacterized protein